MRNFCPSPVLILSCFLQLLVFCLPAEPGPQASEDAQKVLETIDRIQKDQDPASERALRTVIVSERELNAYIAYRIETEQEEIMKELSLKLLPENRVEGKIFIDLSGRKIPFFIKRQMDIYFAGILETEETKVPKARIRAESLFLGEQRIPPALLDMIIRTIAKIENAEPMNLEDWYDLPYGIRKLETQLGELVVSY